MSETFVINPPRIFVVRRRGRAAVISVLFQGSAASSGGKKTGAVVANVSLASINALGLED